MNINLIEKYIGNACIVAGQIADSIDNKCIFTMLFLSKITMFFAKIERQYQTCVTETKSVRSTTSNHAFFFFFFDKQCQFDVDTIFDGSWMC